MRDREAEWECRREVGWLLSELSMQLTEMLYVIFIIYQRSEHLDKVDCSSGLHGTEDTLKVLPL